MSLPGATDLPSPLDAVADMRATARWTAAAVGAVGATVLAGAPLAALGRIQNTGDVVAVAIGMVVALAGVSWAIWHTAEALTPPLTTQATYDEPGLADLRAVVAHNPAAVFGPFGSSMADLHRQLDLRRKVVSSLEDAVAADPTRPALVRALADARANLDLAHRTARWVLALMHSWQVRNRMRRARWHVLIGMLVVAAGVTVFLTATPEPPASGSPAKAAALSGPVPDAG
jgi:hypothetical protein